MARKSLGLRSEIVLNISILVLAGLVFAGLFLLKLTEKELVQERVNRIVSSLQALSHLPLTQEREGGYLDAVEEAFLAISFDSGLAAYELFDRSMQRIAGSPPVHSFRGDLEQALRSGKTIIRIHQGQSWTALLPGGDVGLFDIVMPLYSDQGLEGGLYARFSLDDIGQRVSLAQTAVMVLVFIFGGILVGFGAYLLGRTVIQPIRQLMVATSRVADGQLDTTLSVSGPREILELESSFNTMTRALHTSRQKTEKTINSLHQANRELALTQRNLVQSEKMAAVGHLAAGMAHELGNPLGAATGYLQMVQAEAKTQETRDLVARTLQELDRIDRLVRELLDFAAPSSHGISAFDPAAIAREAIALLKNQGVLKNVQFSSAVPLNLPAVQGSGHKLLQVFVNLLINARDACGENGSVRLTGRHEKDTVIFEIVDDGEGMDPEIIGRIFDPFFTTKEPGKGRGLGLFFCHRAIEEAGGVLEVMSRPEQGTRFSIRFPSQPVEKCA